MGEQGIWISDVDGSDARLLVSGGTSPSISPDGKWVVYNGDCDESGDCEGAFVIPVDGGKPHRISVPLAYVSWSPDSGRLVGLDPGLLDAEDATLSSIDVGNGDAVTLAQGAVYGASFSPDGKRIVYAVAQKPSRDGFIDEEIDLFITGREGGDAKQITDDGQSGWPVWGPKSIAFSKMIPSPEWGRFELWQIQPDGSGRRPIIAPLPKRFVGSGYEGLIPIDWSDDGLALLAGWANEWGAIPIAVDPRTGEARQLLQDQASQPAELSTSGDVVLAFTVDNVGSYPDRNTVLVVPYAGGKAEVIARGALAADWNR